MWEQFIDDWGNRGKDTNVTTNADHIRAMTDCELLNFLWYFDLENVAVEKSRHKILKIRLQDWLKQPYEEVDI